VNNIPAPLCEKYNQIAVIINTGANISSIGSVINKSNICLKTSLYILL